MRPAPLVIALSALCAGAPALAQKPGGSLGNLPPSQQAPQVAPQQGRPGLAPQMALPRDKPPPLGGSVRPPVATGPGAVPRAPGQMGALPRDKPPPLAAIAPGAPPGGQAGPAVPRGRQP